MNKKEPKEIFQPPLLPTISLEEIIGLLKARRDRGEELLNSSSLSPGALQDWNFTTKQILTKAFGPCGEYVDSVLYSGEDNPLSAYEPESNLEKMRRKNLRMAMLAVGKCMEEILLRGSAKGDLSKEAKGAKNAEPQGPPQISKNIRSQQEEKELVKELCAAPLVLGESTRQETSPGVKSMNKTNQRKVLVIAGPDEDRKEAVVFLLKKLDLDPLFVAAAGGQGTDLSKKYEMYKEAAFSITLLNGDDMGFPKGKPEKPRPRPAQDVIFELGYLMGLGHPQSACALYEEGLDLPSGCSGVGFIPYDGKGLWKLLLARAMKMASVDVDLNKAV